jgi:hypothetical protein
MSSIRSLLVLVVLLVSACSQMTRKDEKLLQLTLREYATTVRWGEFADALRFLDSGENAAKAPPSIELERWKQWRVAGYREQPYVLFEDGYAEQIVQIELIHQHSQSTRSIVDKQRWRYDAEKESWRLTSGLPRLTPER